MELSIHELLSAWVQLEPVQTGHIENVTFLINAKKIISRAHLVHASAKIQKGYFKKCHFITSRAYAKMMGYSEQWDEMVKIGSYSLRVTPSSTIEN